MRLHMKLSHRQILVLSLGLSLVLTVVGCSRSAKKELAAKNNNSIQLGVAVAKDVPIQIRGSGHVTPFASVAVKSRVDGELERALFNEGDELKRGETILVIDSRIPQSALRQAEANLQRDEALAASAEADSIRSNETTLAVVNQTRPAYVDFLVPEEQLPAIQERVRNGESNVNAMIPGGHGKSSLG